MEQPIKLSSRRWSVRFGILLISMFVTLLLLEAGIRLLSPQDLTYWDSRPFRRLASTSPHFVENIPNTHTTFIGVPVTINRLGLRGDDIVTLKPPHTIRIVVVGDSVAFGYGIPFQDTYAKVLEKRLNEDPARRTRYEVLNGGTLGGSLADYLHFLSEKAELLQPDVVLLGVTLNDILVYSESGSVSEAAAKWQGTRQRQSRFRRLSQFMLRHSHLYLFCYSKLKSSLYSRGWLDITKVQGADYSALAPPSPYQARAWESSLEMLSRILVFCRAHGYRVAVVVFPMQMQMSAAELQFYRQNYRLRLGDATLSGEPQQRLREFAAAQGITLIDLLPTFRAHLEEGLYLHTKMIPSDPTHPSIQGNKVAAEEILRQLPLPE